MVKRRLSCTGTVAVVLLALIATAGLPVPAMAASGAFTQTTGRMIHGREFHSATLLLDGTVMVTGGRIGSTTDAPRAESYDPATGRWVFIGEMTEELGRSKHTATLLSNGNVLIVGGNDAFGLTTTPTAEIYDAVTRTFTATGSLSVPRQSHAATRLADGKVLVSGGLPSSSTSASPLASAEIYDPATGTWTPMTGVMTTPRSGHTSTLLGNGRVLVTGKPAGSTGGLLAASAELFDPGSQTWTATGAMALDDRTLHSATRLGDGSVLVAGGNRTSTAPPEVYNPVTGTWSTTQPWKGPRLGHAASLLMDGRVLVSGAGGINGTSSTDAEIYDPATRAWASDSADQMTNRRQFHPSTVLKSGLVLVAGGNQGVSGNNEQTDSSDLFDPGPQTQRSVSLSLGKHLIASGSVGGPQPCVGAVKVAIRRNGVGVASTTSAADGSYSIRLPDQTGKYQAVVKPGTIVNEIPCAKAVSAIVKHIH